MTFAAIPVMLALTLGYQIDVSRDKVPTMESLRRVVDILSAEGYGQFQLYTEHAFAYSRHREVWKDASPMTAEEVRGLDGYCAEKGIDLVPNQNSFGHLSRWLKHPAYRPFALHPEGNQVDPAGRVRRNPAVLDPFNPASLELLDGLYAELFPCFRSHYVNIGCDETFELTNRAAYVEFLGKVAGLARARGKRPMFWADILTRRPDANIARVPKDLIALEWGYHGSHPFDARCRLLKKEGFEFYVCPGTAGWKSVYGRVDQSFANISNAYFAAVRQDAKGLLLADWGDEGYSQPWIVALPPIVYAAQLIRQGAVPSDAQVVAEIDRLLGCRVGASLLAYGRLYRRYPNTAISAESRIFNDIWNRRTSSDAALRAAFAEAKGLRDLASAPEWVRTSFAVFDLFERVLFEGNGPSAAEEFRRLWLKDNRSGGLDDSVAKLFGDLEKREDFRNW